LDDSSIYHISAHLDGTVHISIDLLENPALAFEMFGLVKYDQQKHIFVLTPKAFKWADYEHKNRFLKIMSTLSSKTKDFMLFVAFVLSLGLTVLQILQSLKPAP
jgi:hypothetical protein